MKKTLADEAEEIREITREAHEAIKDLRAAMKEWRNLKKEVEEAAQVAISTHVDMAVEQGLAEYQAAIIIAIERSTEAVYERFDTLSNTLLGEGDRVQQAQGEDEPSIRDYARAIAQARRDSGKVEVPFSVKDYLKGRQS